MQQVTPLAQAVERFARSVSIASGAVALGVGLLFLRTGTTLDLGLTGVGAALVVFGGLQWAQRFVEARSVEGLGPTGVDVRAAA